jgi:hypothetical protein
MAQRTGLLIGNRNVWLETVKIKFFRYVAGFHTRDIDIRAHVKKESTVVRIIQNIGKERGHSYRENEGSLTETF